MQIIFRPLNIFFFSTRCFEGRKIVVKNKVVSKPAFGESLGFWLKKWKGIQ